LCAAVALWASVPALAQTAQLRLDEGALLIESSGPVAGELAVWVDHTDVSAWLQRPRLDQWKVPAAVMAWLPGARSVRLFRVDAGRWLPWSDHELASGPAAKGPPALKPRLDLAIKAQPDARASGSQTLAPRRTFEDLTLRAALAVDQPLGASGALRGAVNLAGSSHRPEALRWQGLQLGAPKVDLADYRFELTAEPLTLGVGHLGFGAHPLLLDGFGTRGLSAKLALGERWDLQFAAGNGSAIVGIDNPLGLEDPQHQLRLASLGVELDPAQPGRWRAELQVLDATLRATANFNRGEIPEAERIRGLGLRGRGSWLDGRLRVDLALARSRHDPAEDPQLQAAAPLRAIAPATRNAVTADASYELLRGWAGWSERLPLTLALQAGARWVAPLYKTVGTFLAADQKTERLAATAAFGAAQLQLFADRREDNLDELPNLLKTGTRNAGAALVLPPSLWGAEAAPKWLPSATLRLTRNRQRALNAPDFAQSGIAPTHRPDQATRGAQLALAWAIDRWSIGYQWQSNFQDNRQPGREAADFLASGHQGQVQWSATDALQLALNLGRSRNHGYERSRAEFSDSAGLSINWQVGELNALNAQAQLQRGHDSLHQTSSRQDNLQAQWTHRLAWRHADGTPLPAQAFVRYARLRAANTDRTFGTATSGVLWTLNAGIGITLGSP
jgi:hypothetical protein